MNCNLNSFNINNIPISPPVVLAPMAGATDYAFRTICKSFGVGLMVSEMVSAKGLFYDNKKTNALIRFEQNDRPFAIQIFGSQPNIMANATEKILKFSPDIIDINMGCPTPKIVNNGDGSALMKDLKLAEQVIKAVVKVSCVPVSVKFRAGWDEQNLNAVELAKICEQNGVSAITVHGRTRQQFYSPPVNLEIIKKVKQAVKIPVIGNGDINSADDAINMMNFTGCDGVMIGRGALGNPFIFSQILKALNNQEFILPTVQEKLNIALKQLEIMVQDKGEKLAILEARKHISWYLKVIKNSHNAKVKVNTAKTYNEMKNILLSVI